MEECRVGVFWAKYTFCIFGRLLARGSLAAAGLTSLLPGSGSLFANAGTVTTKTTILMRIGEVAILACSFVARMGRLNADAKWMEFHLSVPRG